MADILEIDSVIKYYGERSLLTDIYMKCHKGDIIGMLGRNGCGKSTLLQIIFGTIAAEKFIRINGKVYDKPYREKDLVCYLPQHDFLPKYVQVKKTVQLYLNSTSLDAFFDDELLGKLKHQKVGELSGGELRYLEIKLLLNTTAKFVLLDEPFNGVAPVMINFIKKLIKEKSQVKGIIITDHDYNNVLDIATRYCLIHQGSMKEVHGKADLAKWGYIPEAKVW